MTSFTFMASTAVLVLLLITSAKGYVLQSFLPPSFDNICNEVECGKGNCTIDLGSRFGFSCACDNGWKHTASGNDTGLQFLPCIFPNCSLNYSCMPAPPPAPVMSSNLSIFDPCYWVDCGEGTCKKNTTFSYTCECDSGAYNLLNNTKFPCYSNCSLGSDCKSLGIGVSAPPPPMPPPPGSQVMASNPSQPPAPSSNIATALLPGEFHWRAIIFVLMILSSIN